ncbi:MAG: hypothetical protein ACO1RT_18760 [Planctomycetaceae bacterium]
MSPVWLFAQESGGQPSGGQAFEPQEFSDQELQAQPSSAQESSPRKPSKQEFKSTPPATKRLAGGGESTISQSEGEALVRKLGAPTFAEREQAVGEILQAGMPMAPFLRSAIADGGDAELVLRAKATLSQLTTGNFEARVASFLSGRSDGTSFEGWLTVAATLGDTRAVRELFIQIVRVHPQLVESLDGNTRDRTVAVDQAAQLIQSNMVQRQIFPTLADGVALLLPLADPEVAISSGYESTLVSVLQKQMSTLRRDASLWTPVSGLLDRWISRSRIEHRNDVLWYAMQWDLAGGGALGVRTLRESTDVETLQTAMQAIARFGTPADAKALVKFIEDDRPAVTRMPVMVGNEALRVTLGDAALAAIAVLYQVPLQDIGMKQGELHDKMAFLVDNAGYLPAQSEERAKAVKTVRGWLSGEAPPRQGRPVN